MNEEYLEKIIRLYSNGKYREVIRETDNDFRPEIVLLRMKSYIAVEEYENAYNSLIDDKIIKNKKSFALFLLIKNEEMGKNEIKKICGLVLKLNQIMYKTMYTLRPDRIFQVI